MTQLCLQKKMAHTWKETIIYLSTAWKTDQEKK